MNILKFELKRQVASTIMWTCAFVIVMSALYIGVYPVFRDSFAEISTMLLNMPAEFLEAFSLDISSISDLGGFYGFINAYLSLMGAIMAASLGLAIFGREKKVKCTDFLLTKPYTRQQIFMVKYAAGFLPLLVFNLIFMSVNCYFGGQYDQPLSVMIPVSGMMFLTQILFYHIGIYLTTTMKKIRSVASTATFLGFLGFILVALNNILDLDKLKYISPLKYFDPALIFNSASTDYSTLIVGCVVLVVLVVVAFVNYVQQDVKAV